MVFSPKAEQNNTDGLLPKAEQNNIDGLFTEGRAEQYNSAINAGCYGQVS